MFTHRHRRPSFLLLATGAFLVALSATPATGLAQDAGDAADSQENASQDDEEVVRREERDSGLIIEDLEMGGGEAATAESAVTVRCIGRLEDGSVFFDSEKTAGGPLTFALGQVIPGWQRGIPGMKEGGVRRLVIPPELAYGKQGRPPQIPGDATLSFRIELVDVHTVEVETLEEGEGNSVPEQGAVVTIRYKGMLEDGTVFDETEGDATATFNLARLIPGWRIGIPGMKPGEVRRIEIPYQLAYGEAGRPPQIPPKSDLIFEVELVDFPSVETEILKEGEGEPCPPGATVTIEYTGTLEDGTVFDTTEGSGARTFDLDQLIPGWQQGIPGMKPGERRRLEIPYQLAYGEQGRPPQIPARADLTFEIKLQSWKP